MSRLRLRRQKYGPPLLQRRAQDRVTQLGRGSLILFGISFFLVGRSKSSSYHSNSTTYLTYTLSFLEAFGEVHTCGV